MQAWLQACRMRYACFLGVCTQQQRRKVRQPISWLGGGTNWKGAYVAYVVSVDVGYVAGY